MVFKNSPTSVETPRKPKSGRTRRTPRRSTSKSLENIARFHLQRFASSAHNLRVVLMRSVHTSAQFHALDINEAEKWVGDIIKRFLQSGLLDDYVYARGKVITMLARGSSLIRVRSSLATKGVSRTIVEEVLIDLFSENKNMVFDAALKFARRRQIGPYRRASIIEKREEKRELSILARAGFSYSIARQIVDSNLDDYIDQPPD